MLRQESNKLTDLFFFKKNLKHANINWKRKINNDINNLLNKGVPAYLIEKAIKKDADNYTSNLKYLLKRENLIKENQFYYHPSLQVAPSPPILQQNQDGSFIETKMEDDFFLDIKMYFSYKDLIKYFYTKFNNLLSSEKKDIGAFKYVYEETMIPRILAERNMCKESTMNALDLLLFTIDAAKTLSYDTDRNLLGILNLTKYVNDGLYIYKEKIHYSRLNQIDHVY